MMALAFQDIVNKGYYREATSHGESATLDTISNEACCTGAKVCLLIIKTYARIEIRGLGMNRLTIETIDVEDIEQIDSLMAQILTESRARIKAELVEGMRAGLLDEHGNLLVHKLPDDMREDAAQDFGG